MAKGKAKININENMAPAQTRSLRSKKKECSTSESSQAHDVQASLLQKETEGDIKEADNGALQSNLQDGATVTKIEHQGEGRPSLSKPDDATDMGNKKKEETSVHDPTHRFEVETCGDQANDRTNEKETSSEECSRSPSQPQILVPPSENDLESCFVVLEKQAVGNRPSNLKRNQDGNTDNPSFGVSAVSEAAVGLPAKKKRRMGMSGLTEKERSHFLQAGQHNSAKSGEGVAAKQKHSKTMKPVALHGDDSPAYLESSPPHISAEVVEQREEEPKSPHSGEGQRAETDVVTASDGAVTTSNPGGSEGGNSGAKEGSLADPELNGNTEPVKPAEEGEQKHQKKLQPPQVQGPTTGNLTQMPEIQRQTEGELSSKVQSYSLKTSQAKQDEDSDADSVRLQVCCVSGTTDESKPQRTDVTCADGADGAEGGASSAALQSEDLNCGSVKLCEASVTPTVPEVNDSRDPSARPAAGPSAGPSVGPSVGPSAVHTAEGTRTADPEDPFGSGCSGYVSDSQLNAITLIEEREEEEPDPSGHLEDATELVCGLIRELSSLNRRVMVAHRELENLRRKPSRSSVR